MSIVAPAISAFGPLHRRQAPPPGSSADHSASESVSQRPPEGLPTPRCTPGHPPEIRKVPVNAGSQRRRLGAGPPHRRPPGPAIGGTRVRSSRCCSDPTTAACRRPPVEFAAVAADEHRRAGDLGIRTPPPPSGTAAWPSADHSASESVSQRPPEGLPTPRCTPGYPPEIRKVPVSAGSWCRWPHAIRHACTRTLNINPTPAPRRRRGHHSQRITASLTQIRAPSTAVS